MSRNMRKFLIIFLVFIILASFWRIFYENRKTTDNLPSLERTLLTDAGEVNKKLSGYMEHQLLEVWGKPNHSDSETMIWVTPEGMVRTTSNSQGEIQTCSVKLKKDVLPLEEVGELSEEDVNRMLTERISNQLTTAWGEPEEREDNSLIWKLPEGSSHKALCVELGKWGIVGNAKFIDKSSQ